MILKNSNGCEYDVLSRVENFEKGDNLYLLAEVSENYFAGGSPVQYVVARGWDEKYKCWNSGEYFSKNALRNAENYFYDVVARIIY